MNEPRQGRCLQWMTEVHDTTPTCIQVGQIHTVLARKATASLLVDKERKCSAENVCTSKMLQVELNNKCSCSSTVCLANTFKLPDYNEGTSTVIELLTKGTPQINSHIIHSGNQSVINHVLLLL